MNTQTNSLNNIVAVVPAAGIGTRIKSDIPKQYIKLGQKTILEYTIDKLLMVKQIKKIIIVIDALDSYFASLPLINHPKVVVTHGGKNRSDSVLCGLNLADNDDWVLVHDAARPCVMLEDIQLLINRVLTAQKGGILATRVTDTIKKVNNKNSDEIVETVDRELLWAAATPQMFNVGELKASLESAYAKGVAITDEASAIEYSGGAPLLVECRRDNIKVTRNEDLALARFYLMEQGYL